LQLYCEIQKIRKFLLRFNTRIHFLPDEHPAAGNPVAPPKPRMEMSAVAFVAPMISTSPAPVTTLCSGQGKQGYSQVTQGTRGTQNARSFHGSLSVAPWSVLQGQDSPSSLCISALYLKLTSSSLSLLQITHRTATPLPRPAPVVAGMSCSLPPLYHKA